MQIPPLETDGCEFLGGVGAEFNNDWDIEPSGKLNKDFCFPDGGVIRIQIGLIVKVTVGFNCDDVRLWSDAQNDFMAECDAGEELGLAYYLKQDAEYFDKIIRRAVDDNPTLKKAVDKLLAKHKKESPFRSFVRPKRKDYADIERRQEDMIKVMTIQAKVADRKASKAKTPSVNSRDK